MTLDLVTKHGLSSVETLTREQHEAIRQVASGVQNEGLKELVLAVMKRARTNNLWLGCDCRSEVGRRPVVAPCRNDRGTDYWRVLTGRQLLHDQSCVFYRSHVRRKKEDLWNRPARTVPVGYFSVLRERPDDLQVSEQSKRAGTESVRGGGRRPALSQLLLMLLERADLNLLRSVDGFKQKRDWRRGIWGIMDNLKIAPGRPLRDLWFDHVRMWNGNLVFQRVRTAARDWPAGHKPQGFLCWVVRDMDDLGIGTTANGNRVDVVSGVGCPVIGGNRIKWPYLFLGAVGLPKGRSGYECLEGYAQPIVATDCLVPVDSNQERRAFGTLRTTLRILKAEFPDAEFEIEKPVFEFETFDGPCLPDFLIRARRGEEVLQFVVEVMGFDRVEYALAKEVTHPRMRTLGTLCTMQATEFDRISGAGLKSEGRKVTETIRRVLRDRWKG